MFVQQALKYSSLIMYNFLFLTALEIYNYESIITENLTELNSYAFIQVYREVLSTSWTESR